MRQKGEPERQRPEENIRGYAPRSPSQRVGEADGMLNERYAELAELAGSFIHDLKNHLGTLGINLDLLAEDFREAQNPREKRAFQKIQKLQQECSRLVELSNDFLRFARLEKLETHPADLTEVIEELVDFYTPRAKLGNVEIKTYLPADLPAVALDRDLFKQALLNLFLNAQQAMPNGGELTIQAALEKSDSQPDHVCLSLIDTGAGMSPEVLARVFKPFYSTRPGGSGLGLPTTRRIVEAHGGTIEVQSDVGRGTRFAIRLPVLQRADKPVSPEKVPADALSPSAG